ncbi:hypothetical protein THAOC_04950 [Thalassiosira oceanica]|uniref:Uncharacterized protein n=1 Tax=Thalassiosira oceanica TaxID=159749 RepID=K0T3Z5_THAOC|nr:hypothetical protein THAOC_04950 [Thalassiosira oceanica]|eukprot:EJK73423.1 hypothetical protein THAOC_04950 [Thalassiosira oceanica]
MFFSQLFDKGFHIGAELCPGLVANSMSNLKALTAKGVVNLMDGKLDKESVEQCGELAHNVPPRAFFVHGNLEAIEHLGGFDFVYCFDAVNSWETKLAMANAWNHPKSRRCMVVVSNSTEAEMEALGYKDIIFKEGVRVQFRTSGNESLVAHVYKRKSLRKCRHKYSFESPNAETCPMFAKAFELYRKGDEVARMTFTGYKKNTLLFDANLGSDPHSLMP